MERSEFGSKLKTHDWYYGYSDDHSVWKRGQAASARLRQAHESLSCPYDMNTLMNWAHKMILEEFAEEEPGAWYRQPRKYKCVAPTKREVLMTRKKHDEITQWFALGSTVEEIGRFV